MKRYDEMRDSGHIWLGQIPKHWRMLRMKNVFEVVSERNHPDAEVLSLYREYGVLPKNSRDDNHNVTSEDTASYKFVHVDDLVINKMKAWQGSLGISQYEGIVSPAYYVCRFVNDGVSKRYYHYLLRSRTYAQEFERLSTGMRVGQWDLGIDDFMSVPALIPPMEEQQAIAAYLDDQVAQIDSIITETQASISEYKQFRAASIEEEVLGIKTQEKKRKSGEEWIGEIPSSWEIVKLKTLFTFGKGLPITKDNLIESGVAVISYGQIHAKYNSGTAIDDRLIRYVPDSYLQTNPDSLVAKGDILVADTSEDTDGCGNAVYVDKDMTLFAGYHTIILKSLCGNDNKYLSYLFRTNAWRSQIRSRVSGVKLFSISKRILNLVTVVLPSKEEQLRITQKLDRNCNEIDEIIAEKEKRITELEIYKRSLIYEAVTGKRKVV